jgi:hypothetical protein
MKRREFLKGLALLVASGRELEHINLKKTEPVVEDELSKPLMVEEDYDADEIWLSPYFYGTPVSISQPGKLKGWDW